MKKGKKYIMDDNLMQKMIKLLLSDAVGKLYAYNGYFSVIHNLLNVDYVKEYIVVCCDYFSKVENCSFQELHKILHMVAAGCNDKSGKIIKFFLLGQDICSDLDDGEDIDLVNIIDYRAFNDFFVDERMVHDGHEYLDGIPDYKDDENIEKILVFYNGRDIYNDDAVLGGGKTPMFWVTCAKELMGFERGDGDKVRDKLGLIHYKENTYLMQIGLNSGDVRYLSHKPTFFDGYDNRRFKVNRDRLLGKYNDWGITADLELVAKYDNEIDGVPERVVAPIKMNKNMSLKYIGRVDCMRGNTIADDDKAFLSLISLGIDVSIIEKFFMEDIW